MLPFRIGHGYDIHVLAPRRPLILGGVTIPHTQGLLGHSDADCLSHAIADSILGAACLPDIGQRFPNNDMRFKGLDSRKILEDCLKAIKQKGFILQQIDTTLIAEAPQLAPHTLHIQKSLGTTLGLPTSQIGLKATTKEGLGAIGRGEAIAAHALCLLQVL